MSSDPSFTPPGPATPADLPFAAQSKPDALQASLPISALPPEPLPFRELIDPSMAKFTSYWRLHNMPDLRATFNQRESSLTISFSDSNRDEHSVSLWVGESSVGRFSAMQIAPGQYHLGDPSFYGGAWEGHGRDTPRADQAEGWASIPIRNADGKNVVAAYNSGAPDSSRVITDGGDVMYHGGGTGLPDYAAPRQSELEPTLACVRGFNADVLAVAELVKHSGGSIPLEIESGRQSIMRSKDNGATWSEIPPNLGMLGTIKRIEDGIAYQNAGRAEFRYKVADLEAAGFPANQLVGRSMYIGTDSQGQSVVLDSKEYLAGREHGQQYLGRSL